MKWILGAGAPRILASILFTVCWAVAVEWFELTRAPGVLPGVQFTLRRTVGVGGQHGARAPGVNVGVQRAVGGAVGVEGGVLTRAPGVPAPPSLAVRRTVGVGGVSRAGAPGVHTSVEEAVGGAAGTERVLDTVRGAPGVLGQTIVTVGLIIRQSLGPPAPGVHPGCLRVIAGQRLTKQLHALPEWLGGGLGVLQALGQHLVTLLVLLLTLVPTPPLADLHLAGCEHVKDVRKLEGRKVAIGDNVKTSLGVWLPPGVEAIQQLILHDAAPLVSELQLDCVGAVILLAGVGKALLDVHVVHVFIVLGVHQHGQLLPDLDSGVNLFRIRIFANLKIHPTIHRVALKLDLLKVQHHHLERLKLHSLLDEVDPLAVDLPGAVPDLLDVFTHLDDDDVAEACFHL